jgi:hypothetical protein
MYQYNKYMFNFIDIYSFIPVSGCVGMGSGALLCPGPAIFVKTALVPARHVAPIVLLLSQTWW